MYKKHINPLLSVILLKAFTPREGHTKEETECR
jgi:hypothetical protein